MKKKETKQEKKNIIKVSKKTEKLFEAVGIDLKEDNRSGSFILENDDALYSEVKDDLYNQVEIIDIREALKKYKWLKNFMWKLIKKDKDNYTKLVHKKLQGGYFIRVLFIQLQNSHDAMTKF